MNDSGYSQLPEDIINLSKIYWINDDLIIANDAETVVFGLTPTCYKEITLRSSIYPASKLRIKFDFYHNNSFGSLYAQIYRNGIPIGTLAGQALIQWDTISEDLTAITDWKAGDKIQLYGYHTDGGNGRFRNLRIYGKSSEFENTIGA
jgi:hypothetical protein